MRILRRRPSRPKPVPTGHPLDDQLLLTLSRHSDLTEPRHWVHYLYFPEEADARGAGAAITAAGWEIQALEPAVEGRSWVVVPEQHDAVVSESAVVAARQFFEDVAARVPGAEYDGWEASA